MGTVQARAEKLAAEAFTGGPVADFEQVGRVQLIALLEEGLEPGHRVLDIGCGALRAGYWLMHFLQPGHYYGIEPNEMMLQAGIRQVLDDGQIEAARPTFDHNDRFDLSVFNVEFDVMLARSIWTHASKSQILAMLDGFLANSTPRAFLLTSFLPAGRSGLRRAKDYLGNDWVGKSHESEDAGLVAHDMSWIRSECAARGLAVELLDRREVNRQRWLRIEQTRR